MFLKRILAPLKWSRSYQSKILALKNPLIADVTTTDGVEALKKKPILDDLSDTSEVDMPFRADLSSEALKKKPMPDDLFETSEAQRPSHLSKTSEESKSPLKILNASMSDHYSTILHESKSSLKILRSHSSISKLYSTESKNLLKILPSDSSISDQYSAGTADVCIRTGNIAFAGTDAGDKQKLFAFEGDKRLYGKVLMMYRGFSHYPLLIGKELPSIVGEVNAYTLAMYAKSFRDVYKLAAEEMDLFNFRMTFVSAEKFNTVVYQLNGFDGSVERINSFAIIQGAGKELGHSCYDKSFDNFYDLPTRWGYDACENYLEAFHEYLTLDVLLACSESKSEPSGGRIQVMKISPAGVERVWDNPLNILHEERKKHWGEEEVRLSLDFIERASPIEWNFAVAEKSRFDRGVIDVMRSRSYERCRNFLSPNHKFFKFF